MQETTQQQAPAAPATPGQATGAGAPAPVPVITIQDAAGVTQTLRAPATLSELSALRERRNEISNQLTSVAERRRELANELLTTPEGASKAGLEARLKVLDQRIVQLETDLSTTGRLLSLTPTELVGMEEPQYSGQGEFEEGLLAGGIPVLMASVIAYFFLRRRWRKRSPQRGTALADMSSDNTQRLERLEQGMESIAIEIERVSEGQRFVTRLLSEAQPAPAARRVAEPAHLPTIEG